MSSSNCFTSVLSAGAVPKKSRNMLFIDHWRPISLLCVDYKALTKLFAKRLKDILPDIIHPDQRGFISNRRASNGILDLYAMLDLIEKQEEDFLICSIDIKKAFDSVDWDFIRYALKCFGFPPEFVKWFDVFYTERTAYVWNNGSWSDAIKIEKGNFQGCPLSPLLFVISIEVLASRIRANPEIQGLTISEGISKNINLVADDLLLVFKNTFSGCDQVEEELNEFSLISGLKINKEKSSVNSIKLKVPLDNDKLPFFSRNQGPISYIGFTLNPCSQESLWSDNIDVKFNLMMKDYRCTRELASCTTYERITVLKALFFSRLPYFMERLPLPSKQRMKYYQGCLSDLVWNGKQPKMKLNNIVASPSEGGMGMIHFENRLIALKLHTLAMACNTLHIEFWQQHLFNKFTVPFDSIIRANLKYSAFKALLKPGESLHQFWSDCFRCWCDFHFFDGRRFMQCEKEEQEVLFRPLALNSYIVIKIFPSSKRYSNECIQFFEDQGWFSVADFLHNPKVNRQDNKSYISAKNCSKMFNCIPIGWKALLDKFDPLFYSFAQQFIDQKFTLKALYQKLLSPDFAQIQRRWQEDNVQCNHWELLALNVKLLVNVSLKNFFILFNNRGLLLNSQLSKFAPVSPRCSFCGKAKESYVHLFWECSFAQTIWCFIWTIVKKDYCTQECAMFPTDAPNNVKILFTHVKYFLYRCRLNSRTPNVKWFKNFMIFHLEALKFVAFQRGKSSQHDKQWYYVMDKLSK